MQSLHRVCLALVVVSSAWGMLGCNGGGDGQQPPPSPTVTLQGRVDDGTPHSPIANAQCQVVDVRGSPIGSSTTDTNGRFQVGIPPGMETFIGCHPPAFPNLVLATFVSTVGVAAGQTRPETGVEEISPRTTVIANILAETHPADRQRRKTELLNALGGQDPDLSLLAGAATALFNAMLQSQITAVDFTPLFPTSEDGGSGDSDGGVSGDSDGGVSGGVGDGAELSPLPEVLCEFTPHLQGNSALADVLDGAVDRPELQRIASRVPQGATLGDAFARLFPEGLPPLVKGQPLRTRTDANGAYFLSVPPSTPGFVFCAARANLALAAFVRGRQVGETLTNQDVSPPSEFFAALLQPLFPAQEVPTVAENFQSDIGELYKPRRGVVRLETVQTANGLNIADTNGDGVVCSFVGGTQAAAVLYPPSGGAAVIATTLFKAFLVEARQPAILSYADILTNILTRTDQGGHSLIEVRAEDLVHGGVPAARAAMVTPLLNTCFDVRIRQDLATPLPEVVRAGRIRVTVRHASGTLVSNAQVVVEGTFPAPPAVRCPSGTMSGAANRLVCQTDANGQVIFILFGQTTLGPNPVTVTATSPDGTLTRQVQTAFIPPATRDISVTVGP
jgi:hypothetical protein